MKIGELARQAGCPVETVRYYEREGLLAAARRDELNNYRRYDHAHLERLMFIRRCRALDMTHGEIRALLEARSEPEASCETINDLIDDHLAHVQARIAELQALEAELSDLRGRCCAVRATRDCGILQELDHPADTSALAAGVATHIAGSRCSAETHSHAHEPK